MSHFRFTVKNEAKRNYVTFSSEYIHKKNKILQILSPYTSVSKLYSPFHYHSSYPALKSVSYCYESFTLHPFIFYYFKLIEIEAMSSDLNYLVFCVSTEESCHSIGVILLCIVCLDSSSTLIKFSGLCLIPSN